MTRTELIAILAERRTAHSTDELADRVRRDDAIGMLYALVSNPVQGLSGTERHRLLFQGGYVLERIYFTDRSAFQPCIEDFCRRGFPGCEDPSLRRLFGKIMADLLARSCPEAEVLEHIAETAADWATDPQAKVAVRIWAVEILKRCRGRVGWGEEIWEDLVESLAIGATPGIESRMRRSWLRKR